MANGALHEMAYVEEVTYGVTPATPTLTPIRHNTTSLGLSKDTLTSEELRDDRQIAAVRHGTKQIGGDIAHELSFTSFDDLLEAVLGGTWSLQDPNSGTDQLKAGTTRRSFSIQREFGDLDSGNAFHVYTGCEFNTLSLSLSPSAIVTGTFGVIGKGLTTDASAISGSSVSTGLTTDPMTSIEGSVLEGGGAGACITEMTLDISNGMEPRFCVGDDETQRPSIGRSNVSGQITAFFDDAALLDKFIDEESSSIDIFLLDTDGNQIRIYLPNITYTSGQPDVEGEGPIRLAMSFTAVYDETEATNIIIERNEA